jgi:hypothetical protein
MSLAGAHQLEDFYQDPTWRMKKPGLSGNVLDGVSVSILDVFRSR